MQQSVHRLVAILQQIHLLTKKDNVMAYINGHSLRDTVPTQAEAEQFAALTQARKEKNKIEGKRYCSRCSSRTFY